MNKEEIKELLEKLKLCDDYHNRCDFLMEHSEITYMLDYITNLQQENKQLKEHIEKYEHYCKTTGIEELMKENKKYKEVIDKAIEKVEEVKERRILRLLEMEVLDILKEVE